MNEQISRLCKLLAPSSTQPSHPSWSQSVSCWLLWQVILSGRTWRGRCWSTFHRTSYRRLGWSAEFTASSASSSPVASVAVRLYAASSPANTYDATSQPIYKDRSACHWRQTHAATNYLLSQLVNQSKGIYVAPYVTCRDRIKGALCRNYMLSVVVCCIDNIKQFSF